MPDGAIERIRVRGIDAPEVGDHSPCPALGERARLHLAGLLRQGPVTVETGRRDRYKRVLGVVRVAGRDVAPLMIEARLARPYDGGKRLPWCGRQEDSFVPERKD
jgi:endonuclease YncB( thermonuclease family)